MATIHIRTLPERWRYNIGLLTTSALITQLLTPQPEASILTDTELQSDYWRERAESKTAENDELTQAIDSLEKEVAKLIDERANWSNIIDASSDPSDNNPSQSLEVEATFYTAFCPTGCIGITRTGLDVSDTIYTLDGYRIIATDPNVIALGSTVEITLENGDSFKARAEDTGGDIRGNRIDILVESREEAYRLGRQTVNIEVIE